MATGEIETYFDLLSAGRIDTPQQLWAAGSAYMPYSTDGPLWDVTFTCTFRPIDTNDFDGTCSWTFEIVARNMSQVCDGYAHVVDELGNICATITVPKQYTGPWSATYHGSPSGFPNPLLYSCSDWFRFSSTFTPTPGAHQYGIRQVLEHMGFVDWRSTFGISAATIVLHQTNPTKSAVHIPMMIDENGCEMNWVTIPQGYTYTTYGDEAAGNAAIYWNTYEEGDQFENETSVSNFRQIWKFDEAELKSVSKVVFDASVVYSPDYIYPSYEYFYGVPSFSWCRAGLRWSTHQTSSPGNLSGTYTTLDVTDVGGNHYYYIDGSDCTWSRSADGHSWHVKVDLNIASLTAANGAYLYFCTNENVYGGEGGTGSYHHWGELLGGTFSIPAGRTVTSAWIDYSVGEYYPRPYPEDNLKAAFDYDLSEDYNDAYIILYDKTADTYVPGSELVWTDHLLYERKSVTLPSAALTSGHEYMARWRCNYVIPGDWSDSCTPRPTDINLTVYVQDIEEFTSWHRVTKQHVFATISNNVYDDWGSKPFGDGTANICSRAKLFKPALAEVYYEVCALEFTFGLSTGHDAAGNWSSLWDCGTDDHATGTTTALENNEISAARIIWDAPGLGYTVRKRTGDIAAFVTDQNRYVDDQPYAVEFEFWPIEGFLITHYNNLTDTGEGSDWSSTGCTFSFTQPSLYERDTLIYATGLMEGRNGWFYDKYSSGVLIHYGEEGENIHSILLGAENGGVYQLTGDTDAGTAFLCQVRTMSRDQGDPRYYKLYGDILFDCDTNGADLTVTPGFDNFATAAPAVTVNNAVRTQVPIPVSVDDWVSARNVSLDITWNENGAKPKLYAWEPRFTEDTTKLYAYSWETCFITHEMEGYFYHGYLYLVHLSTADLTFTVTAEDGTVAATITIPHSAGARVKSFVWLPVTKGKIFKYALSSSAQFRVDGEESELLVKQWGSSEGWKHQRIFQDVPVGEAA